MHSILSVLVGSLCLGSFGCTVPFLWNAANGNTTGVQTHLQKGTNVNAALPVIGTNALTLAAWHGEVETVCALLDAGADVNAEDFSGWTPLHAAAYKGNAQAVQLLLGHGARLPHEHWMLKAPVKWAEDGGYTETVKILQEAASAAAPPASAYPSCQDFRGEPRMAER
jgi:ankyrin repeat protein